MEWLAWATLIFFYALPYILGALAVLVIVIVAVRAGFQKEKAAGPPAAGDAGTRATSRFRGRPAARFLSYTIIVVILVVAGEYLVRGPAAFAASCKRGIGVSVFRDAKPDSYALAREFRSDYAGMTDATLGNALFHVAHARVPYVEVQDWHSAEREYGLAGSVASFRDPSKAPGYFKVFRAAAGSPRCRWLLPADVGTLDYKMYLHSGVDNPINKKLLTTSQDRECLAIEYVSSRTARYSVEFSFDQPIHRNLVKHELRVIDSQNANLPVGQSVAYEHKTDGVYSSVLFWLGSGGEHATCPVNLLQGSPLHQILHI